ncbi:PREDICTED: transmembrane epididymal protein 1-like [Elephantulus edwardii]|uniref:transmembrane epididymal protein 1-like n=1 Tax=Elephantulus edwardii TaxID=28737 RepID=UPI0003F0D146|nr:PREDICTED: transmembrane epididymal protein 1-like [Elephantulus edwardii]
MGTLPGHVMIGIFFLTYSLYRSVLLSLALLRGEKLLRFPQPPREKQDQKWWQVVPLEGLMKVVCTVIPTLAEFYYPLGVNRLKMIDWEDPQRSFMFKDCWQHVTMYAFFMISGVVDIVSRSWQMTKLKQAAEALSFYTLMLLMATHLENKSTLEIRVHLLLMLPAFLMALVLTVEIWVPDQPSLWVLRTWLQLIFSNWLLQIAVVIYAPPTGHPWQSDNPEDMAFLPIFFCWHLALGAGVLAIIYGLCSLWYHHSSSCREVSCSRYQPCPTDASSSDELQKLRAEAML